jgi:hypothetical protein
MMNAEQAHMQAIWIFEYHDILIMSNFENQETLVMKEIE